MTTVTQRKLVLDDTPALVLADVSTARRDLVGHDEDDILALIEEGFLLFAWNIAIGTTRDIRILPDCIDHYRRTLGHRQYPRTDAQVIDAMLARGCAAGDKPFMRSTTLRMLLNCSSTHIINLIQDNSLSVVPHTTWGQGPSGAALVTVDSIRSFLIHRRL